MIVELMWMQVVLLSLSWLGAEDAPVAGMGALPWRQRRAWWRVARTPVLAPLHVEGPEPLGA
jgi:hypothetical protein